MRCLLIALAIPLFLPAAAAGPEVVTRFEAVDAPVRLDAGASREVELRWRLEVRETTCSSGTAFGIDFLVERKPFHLGASFQPSGTSSSAHDADGTTRLRLSASQNAPTSSDDVEVLAELNPNNAQCTPSPSIREELLKLRVEVKGNTSSPVTPTTAAPDPVARSPGVNAFVAVIALGLFVVVRRRVR